MRTRITLTLFALIALALFLAGIISLVLVRHAQTNSAKQALLSEVKVLVDNPDLTSNTEALNNYLKTFSAAAKFSSGGNIQVGTLVVSPHGDISPPPPNVPASAINGHTLLGGKPTVTGHGPFVLAAAPLVSANGETVALYLQSELNYGDSIWYFLVAGGVALVVAAAGASYISQRISRRVVAVAAAAHEIAAGNFATRVSGPKRPDYPELRELDASIDTMAAGLQRSQQAEREFLMSISHEFRTPLTSIRGYAEAITEGAVEDPMAAAGVVVSEADRLERLIGDLLDLARLRARQFTLDIAELDVTTIVAEVTAAQRFSFADDDLELTVEVPNGPARVRADHDRLSQVVANLVNNAQKFARNRVEVTVIRDDHSVVISVDDDGPGISAEDLPRIFERLFTSDRHRPRTSGSGLGLAIVAELAAAMGAEVTVHSPLNEAGGTELAVRFPLVGDGAPESVGARRGA